jgi:pimeloyl-ACP methyl ester carboxylesterase
MHDYVMHYLEFIDQLRLDQVDLAGVSMGGRLAAQFTAEHRRRVRKLVLIAPAGLNVPGYEVPDFSKLTPEQILDRLTTKPALIASRLPAPTAEWLAERDREAASFGKVITDLMDRRFTRWLHRINVPSLLVWGDGDRTTPIQQAPEWRKLIPSIQFLPIPGAGHLALEEDPAVAEQIGSFLNS